MLPLNTDIDEKILNCQHFNNKPLDEKRSLIRVHSYYVLIFFLMLNCLYLQKCLNGKEALILITYILYQKSK